MSTSISLFLVASCASASIIMQPYILPTGRIITPYPSVCNIRAPKSENRRDGPANGSKILVRRLKAQAIKLHELGTGHCLVISLLLGGDLIYCQRLIRLAIRRTAACHVDTRRRQSTMHRHNCMHRRPTWV